MPQYIFQNPKTKEIKEIFQRMNEDHVYAENNVQWIRVYTAPGGTIDTCIDPFSPKQFMEKTENKKGTYGDILDRSKEMSEKRKDKAGVDKVEQKWFDNYAKERKGKRHFDDPKRFKDI